MTRRHPKPRRRVGAAAVIEEHRAVDMRDTSLIEHPDGWYWIAPDGRQQFGPFASAEEARADRDAGEGGIGEFDEAADAIGVHAWIDNETGSLAEGAAPPHLDSDPEISRF